MFLFFFTWCKKRERPLSFPRLSAISTTAARTARTHLPSSTTSSTSSTTTTTTIPIPLRSQRSTVRSMSRFKSLPSPIVSSSLLHSHSSQMGFQIVASGHWAAAAHSALPSMDLKQRPDALAGRAPSGRSHLALRSCLCRRGRWWRWREDSKIKLWK